MSKKCNCEKCCKPTRCEYTVCYDPCSNPYQNPCMLLEEPKNPCKPICVPQYIPAPLGNDPCNPCYPCPPYPYPPCPPNPCDPSNQWVNPNYIINSSTISLSNSSNVTITSSQASFTNFFPCTNSDSSAVINLPQISSLNNGGRKILNFVNLSETSFTVKAYINSSNTSINDSMNGQSSVVVSGNSTLTIYSMPGITSDGSRNTNNGIWAIIQK